MSSTVSTVEKLRQLKFELGTYQAVADNLYETSGVEVSPALVWRAVEQGRPSPKVQKALGLRRKRYRRTAEFASKDQMDAFDEMMGEMGLSLSQLCALMMEGEIQVKRKSKIEG